jgi:hypothetical protein
VLKHDQNIRSAVIKVLEKSAVKKVSTKDVTTIFLSLKAMRKPSKENIAKKIAAPFDPKTRKTINAIDFSEIEFWLEKLKQVKKGK